MWLKKKLLINYTLYDNFYNFISYNLLYNLTYKFYYIFTPSYSHTSSMLNHELQNWFSKAKLRVYTPLPGVK